MYYFRIFILCLMVFVFSACHKEESVSKRHITDKMKQERNQSIVHEVLKENKSADFFYLNGIIFLNAENVDWVKNINQTIGEEIAEIKEQTVDPENFNEGSASKLASGTKIYKLANHPGPIYLAVVDGKTIPYLGLIK